MLYNHLLLRLHYNHSPPLNINLNRSISSSLLIFTKFPLLSTMASSSLVLPSISLRRSSISTSSLGFKNDIPRISVKNLDRGGRVFMSVAVGSQSTVVDDALFKDYKPSRAFLFPGQGAQSVGMGVEAQKVPAAAELYKRANDILGFDLLDVCINGPKEKLDSTVLSQEREAKSALEVVLEGGGFWPKVESVAVARKRRRLEVDGRGFWVRPRSKSGPKI